MSLIKYYIVNIVPTWSSLPTTQEIGYRKDNMHGGGLYCDHFLMSQITTLFEMITIWNIIHGIYNCKFIFIIFFILFFL